MEVFGWNPEWAALYRKQEHAKVLYRIMPMVEWNAIEQAGISAHEGRDNEAEEHRSSAGYGGLYPIN